MKSRRDGCPVTLYRVTFVPFATYRILSTGDTIHSVKAYRIERIKSGMKFTCTHCTHSVTTLDFDAKTGNVRTQAATAINEHAAKNHPAAATSSAYDAQQRSWR